MTKHKYKIEIEFETEVKLTFPQDARLLDAMTVQLESLEDGDIAEIQVSCTKSNFIGEVEHTTDLDEEDSDL